MVDPIPVADSSQTIVLDMMVSHFLDAVGRAKLLEEIVRVLRPGGWLFYKTFLLDEDRNAARLLRENPGEEQGTYIHPEIGVPEHVSTEEEIRTTFEPYFIIHKVVTSHGHLSHGKAHKRRSISVYAQRG
jgi:SAM-dependent methyltransferase